MLLQIIFAFCSVCHGSTVISFSLPENETYRANRESRRRTERKSKWITCSSSNELLHAVQTLVKPTHVVAELGSQLRGVSTAISQACAQSVMVDVRRKFPKKQTATAVATTTAREQQELARTRAMRRFNETVPDGAVFREIYQLDDWRSVFLDCSTNLSFDVLVLDVTAIVGNDLEWTTMAIVREFTALFPSCHTVLINSESLNMWATRIVHGERWIIDRGGSTSKTPSLNTTGPILTSSGRRWTPSVKSPRVIATVGVEQYRRTIERSVRAGDAVLEVGCHLGTTTKILSDCAAADARAVSPSSSYNDGTSTTTATTGYAIGVDVGSKVVRAAQKRHKEIFFAMGDAWKTAELLRIQRKFLSTIRESTDNSSSRISNNRRIGFDVVYVDVGGLSGSDGLFEALSLISALINALEPRCLVIKSLCVQRLSSTLVPFWKLQHTGAPSSKPTAKTGTTCTRYTRRKAR